MTKPKPASPLAALACLRLGLGLGLLALPTTSALADSSPAALTAGGEVRHQEYLRRILRLRHRRPFIDEVLDKLANATKGANTTNEAAEQVVRDPISR